MYDRSQCVRAGNDISSFKNIKYGVPQGSVLGPTLFDLFINDITNLKLESNILLYADDIVIYVSGNQLSTVLTKLQSDIDQIYLWSVRNHLSISIPKTKTMLVGRKLKLNSLECPSKLKIGNDELDWVDSFNYLGLIIDETISFNPAIELMHRKAAYKLKTLYLIRNNLTNFGSLNMAKSMILPYLDYGLTFISACQDFAIQRLQRLQNRILKCALGVNRTFGTRELHKLAGVLTICDRVRYNQLTLIHHEVLNNTSLFTFRQTSISSTRGSHGRLLHLNKPNIEQYRKSICYYGPSEWNGLSTELKSCTSLPNFKVKLKRMMLLTYDSSNPH